MRRFPACMPVVKKQTNFLHSTLRKATISPAHHGGRNWFHYWRCWGFQHLPYAVFGPAQKRLRGAQRTTMQNSGDVNFQNWKARSCEGKCPSRSFLVLGFWSFVFHYRRWGFCSYKCIMTLFFFFPQLLGDQLFEYWKVTFPSWALIMFH